MKTAQKNEKKNIFKFFFYFQILYKSFFWMFFCQSSAERNIKNQLVFMIINSNFASLKLKKVIFIKQTLLDRIFARHLT